MASNFRGFSRSYVLTSHKIGGGRFLDIRMLGEPQLQAALKELPMAIQRKIVRRGLRDAAKIHLAEAKRKAMDFSKGPEGRLDEPFMPKIAKGLKLRALKRRKSQFGVAVMTPTKEELGLFGATSKTSSYGVLAKRAQGFRLTKWYPPAHIELGTKKSPALSYLREPFDRLKGAMLAKVAESVAEGIDEVWAKNAAVTGLIGAGYGPYVRGGHTVRAA